jgi:hypothetical protein
MIVPKAALKVTGLSPTYGVLMVSGMGRIRLKAAALPLGSVETGLMRQRVRPARYPPHGLEGLTCLR